MSNIKDLLDRLKWQTKDDFIRTMELDKFGNNGKIMEFIETVFSNEIDFIQKRTETIKIKTAGFPQVKTFKEFNFEFQPNINKVKYLNLLNFDFIESKKNVLFVGTPGVGKTHLAISLGVEAAKNKYSVYFIDCNRLVANLLEAKRKNQIEERLKHYCKYKLLIIDEMGFLPLNQDGANVLFQLINKRYETKSTIITTNKNFSEWVEIFNDQRIASAILDRLLHHSIIFNIEGKSYRTYEALIEQTN